ncbi:MAG: glycoside hydrolase [Gallionellaceae bacterium]|jgi:alpha-amylase/alpha-mannosidase (GH57 family)|nr:glycoside hydrolase [Gallionellaceae bacterium]
MSKPLDLIFLWHMHQPDYRDSATGEFVLPWVYLHTIKDYTDMAYHLEQTPGMKAVINFVPVLLDQIEDYAQQFASGEIRDPLLRLLARENLRDLDQAERDLILQCCFRSDQEKMIDPYRGYKRLHDLFKMLEQEGCAMTDYLSTQYLSDLLTWYHLVWCGESVRRENELVVNLMSKANGFDYADRKRLFDLIGELVTGVIPRYRALAARGQIEISATPHGHPLAPLLLNLNSARESMPDCSLPHSPRYSGGRNRVLAHLTAAIESHRARFGVTPQGIWPAEGAVSTDLLDLLAGQGCRWAASGETVLGNTLHAAGRADQPHSEYLYRPYRMTGTSGSSIHCFFRDDHLADLIGFEYSRWYGRDAALHFIAQLEAIAEQAPDGETPVVSIILDGENAWEYYPYNGYYFLSDLYAMLAEHADVRSTTYGEYLDKRAANAAGLVKEGELSSVVAGSWVYGTFSTWIGSPDKNRAWDLLCVAKQSYDLVMASGRLNEEEQRAAERQLASCESSDWFWWFGDYNPGPSVESFDRLYRLNLTRLYQLLKLPVPPILTQPISHGGGEAESGGTMRRAS